MGESQAPRAELPLYLLIPSRTLPTTFALICIQLANPSSHLRPTNDTEPQAIMRTSTCEKRGRGGSVRALLSRNGIEDANRRTYCCLSSRVRRVGRRRRSVSELIPTVQSKRIEKLPSSGADEFALCALRLPYSIPSCSHCGWGGGGIGMG